LGPAAAERLITVPACELCNKRTQQDDDYFRATPALIAEPTPSAALEKIRPIVKPGFSRPQLWAWPQHNAARVIFAHNHP
jgi:hypothetical protein